MKQFILIFQTILISSIVFGQNTNPYKVFGCTTNTNYEIPISCLFRVNNSDSKSNIKALAIDFDKSLAYLLGENDSIMKTLNIDPEEVLIWLSTDPKSDKYPSHSPYHYCSNNPIMRVDPNGMSDDWFQNEKTKDVYYNTNLKRGDEGKGGMNNEQGWQHLGENGIFTNGSVSYEVSNVSKMGGDMTLGRNGFDAEIMLRGENAESFMNNQGYNSQPTQIVESTTSSRTVTTFGGGRTIDYTTGNRTQINEKYAYFPKDFTEISRAPISNTRLKGVSTRTARMQVSYANGFAKYASRIGNFLNKMRGNHVDYFNIIYPSWGSYPNNNTELNIFRP